MPKGLDHRLNVDGREMRLTMRLLYRVRPYAAFVHRQRHQRNTQPGSDALDEGVSQSFHAAAAACRNDCGERCGNALPSVGSKHKLFGGRRPCALRKIRRRDAADRRRSATGRLPQSGIERGRFLQSVQALCDERRLIGKHRVVELEIDPDAARLAWRCHAAPGITGDEGAPAYFADDKPAAQ